MPSPRGSEHTRLMSLEFPPIMGGAFNVIHRLNLSPTHGNPQYHWSTQLLCISPKRDNVHTEPVTHWWQLKTTWDIQNTGMCSKQQPTNQIHVTSPLSWDQLRVLDKTRTFNKKITCMYYTKSMTPDETYCRNCPYLWDHMIHMWKNTQTLALNGNNHLFRVEHINCTTPCVYPGIRTYEQYARTPRRIHAAKRMLDVE